ncbi:MAG: S8 family serine peptidase, partial [Microvirga sp.]
MPSRIAFHPWLSGPAGLGGNPAAATLALGPRSFETKEYRTSWFLGKINAAEAYAAGFSGKGVLVAVVDTGLDIAHPEFIGRVSNLSKSFVSDVSSSPMSDLDKEFGHGTHVSGIVGAARDGKVMHGVAYNATILPLQALSQSAENENPTTRALRYAAEKGAQVLNGSYGPSAFPPRKTSDDELNPYYRVMPNSFVVGGKDLDDEYKAVKAAAKADIVLVFAAGNDFVDQPIASASPIGTAFFPYIRPENHKNGGYRILEDDNVDDDPDHYNNPATYKTIEPGDPRLADIDMSDLQGGLIAVVATDRNNKIASYSNRCGVTFLWCLAAPGGEDAEPGQQEKKVEILSTVPHSRYDTTVGTSMAAPVVAGGAAVLREAFPYMTARQIIEVILTTTDNIGPRETYGRGLFNLGRAARGPREFGAEGFAQSFDVNTRGFDSVWFNDIVGSGRLVKQGDGNLTLTGANTYAGGTTVLGGELTLHGSVLSHVTIGRAGTLRGTGRVDAPLMLAGSLEPGAARSSFGTFTVTGNATLQRSSTYRVDANSEGDHDRLTVGGAATLGGGTLEIVLADGLAPSNVAIQVVTAAGSRTGVFDRFRTNSISAFLDPRLHYVGRNVAVTFERNDVALASVETSAETKDVAEAVQTLGRANRLDEAITRIDAVSADRAFDLLSGEPYASSAVVAYGNARLVQDTILGHLRRSGDENSSLTAAYAADRPSLAAEALTPTFPGLEQRRFALWGEGFGSWGRAHSRENVGALDTSTGGFILGADASVARAYRVGVAAGFTSTTFDVTTRLSTGTNESVFGALYGSARWGAVALRMGASY